MDEAKRAILKTFASNVELSARSGRLTGKPIALNKLTLVDGPRVGGLDIVADYDTLGDIRASLVKNDCAAIRGLLSWNFTGEPGAYFLGRSLRVEAGWTDALSQRDVKVSDLTLTTDVGQWVVGRAENGRTVFASVSDDASSWLISGVSGSGKTIALFSAAAQLLSTSRIVLFDMKGGRDLRLFAGARLVGPMVIDIKGARLALAWAVSEMESRYTSLKNDIPLVLVIDELAALLDDAECLALFKALLTRGREAGVGIIAATQYPDAKTMGEPTIQKGFGGRIGLRVTSQEASRVALGASALRCDTLLGRGDAICKSARGEIRVQIARYDGAIEQAIADMADWPTVGPQAGDSPDKGAFSGQELAIAAIVAKSRGGRPALQSALADAGMAAPGNGRGTRLLEYGRDLVEGLHAAGFDLRAC